MLVLVYSGCSIKFTKYIMFRRDMFIFVALFSGMLGVSWSAESDVSSSKDPGGLTRKKREALSGEEGARASSRDKKEDGTGERDFPRKSRSEKEEALEKEFSLPPTPSEDMMNKGIMEYMFKQNQEGVFGLINDTPNADHWRDVQYPDGGGGYLRLINVSF